jgi:hypothetical protein
MCALLGCVWFEVKEWWVEEDSHINLWDHASTKNCSGVHIGPRDSYPLVEKSSKTVVGFNFYRQFQLSNDSAIFSGGFFKKNVTKNQFYPIFLVFQMTSYKKPPT